MTTQTQTAQTASRSDLTGEYTLDVAHTRLGFVARHAMITKVRGAFNEFEGKANIDAENPAKSSVSITIEGASIDTRNEQRDAHLRSNDFLDLANYPQITFNSTKVEPQAGDVYRVTGDLTIRGVTKPVTFDLEFTGSAVDPFGNTRVGLEGSVKINRKDWGVNWNAALEAGGFLVSEEITLEFEISAIKSAA
ncbi:MAG TPA: YceI family protein [Acidothermaceae bacterium]|jgi:polyisoprenoid-binding protein YceI